MAINAGAAESRDVGALGLSVCRTARAAGPTLGNLGVVSRVSER